MFNLKFGGLATLFVATSFLAVGCSGGDDDDDTSDPTEDPTESPAPEELAFSDGDVSYDCSGENTTTSDWTFSMLNSGWVYEDSGPTVTIFDNLNAYDGDTSAAYCEVHTLELVSEDNPDNGDNSGLNIQEWERVLDYVATANEVDPDVSTTFKCGSGWDTELTYKFCAEDLFYLTGEKCVLIGAFTSEYADETCSNSLQRSMKPHWQ